MQHTFELSSSMSFLIIDENESYRNLISTALKKLGFRDIQISMASMQAIKALKTSKFDLIICDRNMPVLDGCQILKEIRESFEIHGTPFLMMGAGSKVTKEDLVLLAEYEIDGYLTKPFTYKSLIEKITQCLEHYKNPQNIEFNIALAKHKLMTQKIDQAFKMFQKLLEAVPNSARIRICIARCYREMGDYEQALAFCKEAIEKNPLYAQCYDEMGKSFLAQNKIEDAISCFKNAIAISPRYPVRYEQITNILLNKELYTEAEFILKKAFENNVVFDDIDFKYGETLFFLRNLEKALVYFEKASGQSPNDKSLLNLLGICLKDLGRGDDALKHYNVALKRYPGDTKIMFNKALCLVSLDRIEQAKKILKLILNAEPENEKVAEKLAEISKPKIAS